MPDPSFYATTFTVTVLSDRPYPTDTDLAQIAFDVDEGDCVGSRLTVTQTTLSGAEMADALTDAGSDPSFFDLDAAGARVGDA